jgi:diadenosine tetraphosphatase ApaH/serine/threonine PP2A family protein phosphatase
MIDYGNIQKALKHLELQLRNHQGMDASLDTLTREAIAESVIQRFETTYDCLWKVLKRHLGEVLGLADLPNSPKPLLRIAAENRLLPSPPSVGWSMRMPAPTLRMTTAGKKWPTRSPSFPGSWMMPSLFTKP